jgi:precorrin-6A/cobalt-precorrin-6A reductase
MAGDDFVAVATMQEAAAALPPGARAFLAAGRRELHPFAARDDLWCLVRMIEPPAAGETLPKGELILGRPPAEPDEEVALFRRHGIGWVVSKDSGGRAGAKIEAARRLKLPVILVERPAAPAGETVATVEAALTWIERTLFPTSP